jgi:Uma2 family endonuclease
MAMATVKNLLSAEELERMSGLRERHELVRGELVRVTPVGGRHGHVATKFAARLLGHVEQHRLGAVMVEAGYILTRSPDTVRAPDISFLAASRIPPEGLPDGFITGAPDLAIEVVSPDDTATEIDAKVQEYLRAGTRLVAVVQPRTRTLTTYRPDGTARVLQAAERFDGVDVVPGFSLPLEDLFSA